MDPITGNMFMGAGGLQISQPYQGGYFAGYISHTANGVPTHGLIVAPAATGYNGGFKMLWKATGTPSPGATSEYDGLANTAAINSVDHYAAYYCANLSIGGYTDWYLPAPAELDIAYYNLKPTTAANATITLSGKNIYAVPSRLSFYTASNPAQTDAIDFQTGNAEAFFASPHWTSREHYTGTESWYQSFHNGLQSFVLKDGFFNYVRAFRRFAL